MLQIDNNTKNELVIKKSKFITYLIKVNSIEDINRELAIIKNINKGAKHYPYAYILDIDKKYSDDAEPTGTAGSPILNILESNKLNHILCVVVRYFGGIKLGASNLTRSYSNSVINALDNTTISNYDAYIKIKIEFSHDNLNIINSLLTNYKIINKYYTDVISYIFLVPINDDILSTIDKYIIKKEIIEEAYFKI